MGQEISGNDILFDDPLDDAPPPIPIMEHDKIRRVYTHESPNSDENILIVDSAADISCIGQGFKILFHSGETTTIGMALADSNPREFDVVTAAAVVIDPTTSKNIIIIINQAAFIPDLEQHESLLHSDQAWHHSVFVNDLGRCFHDPEGRQGKQNKEVFHTYSGAKRRGLGYMPGC